MSRIVVAYEEWNPAMVANLLKIEPHPVHRRAKYSGAPSVAFWNRVRAIKNRKARDLVYLAGCALQDHEERVLKMLDAASD